MGKRKGQKIKSISKYLLITLLSAVILIIAIAQYRLEVYKKTQIREYRALYSKKRINYTPFIIYRLKKDTLDMQASFIIYPENNNPSVIKASIIKDAYLVHCYFTDLEKIEYIKH